jgi:hypothetical protein
MIKPKDLQVMSILAFALAACTTSAVTTQRGSVEIYIRGSDIETPENTLTRTLRDTLEDQISQRPDLELAIAGKGTLVVRIPEMVQINTVNNSRIITYTAQISRKSDGQGTDATGSCAAADVHNCAEMIIQRLVTLTAPAG